jgi:hypothetical protein
MAGEPGSIVRLASGTVITQQYARVRAPGSIHLTSDLV